jgi:Domain of unknown function (DUF4326)
VRALRVAPASIEYVGRAGRGRKGSPLGNPFKVTSEDERADVITRYDAWLAERIAAGDEAVVVELERLAVRYRAKEHLVLGCWCARAACHGDVLARVIRERAG